VSSFAAAAATLKNELTLPAVSQTVILTRMSGKTSVPEKEKLSHLAKHGATMCIFLSVQMIDQVVQELSESYPAITPVVVVARASWPNQTIIRGTLSTITSQVKEAAVDKTALILVGDVFERGVAYEKSKLYDAEFAR
jgi:precorrin-4/cobalt-precorrin-4 C11-methyltransferase